MPNFVLSEATARKVQALIGDSTTTPPNTNGGNVARQTDHILLTGEGEGVVQRYAGGWESVGDPVIVVEANDLEPTLDKRYFGQRFGYSDGVPVFVISVLLDLDIEAVSDISFSGCSFTVTKTRWQYQPFLDPDPPETTTSSISIPYTCEDVVTHVTGYCQGNRVIITQTKKSIKVLNCGGPCTFEEEAQGGVSGSMDLQEIRVGVVYNPVVVPGTFSFTGSAVVAHQAGVAL